MFEVERLGSSHFSQERRSLAASYGLFGRLLAKELDDRILGLLRQDDGLQQLQALGVETESLLIDSQIETLAIDYCRTFIGPKGNVSLIQSVAVAGRLDSSPVPSMKHFLKFVSVPMPSDGLIDNLGFQLQILAAILESPAAENDEPELYSLAENFFQRHVAWGTVVCHRASEIAETPFYRTLCRTTADLISVGVS